MQKLEFCYFMFDWMLSGAKLKNIINAQKNWFKTSPKNPENHYKYVCSMR